MLAEAREPPGSTEQEPTLTSALLVRHDRPGPRYTSYPTAVEFTDRHGPGEHADQLTTAARESGRPLALYVHLPFCDARCSFCGCHVVVARRPSVARAYLDRVVDEAELVAGHLGERRRLAQYHWGGGTPTHHAPDELIRLHAALLDRFELVPGAEVAVEVDPRVTTREHLETLRGLGFNRLSMGVQDADPDVQELIGRRQSWEQTESAFGEARRLGFGSVNIDLIYGLPGQREASFAETLSRVAALRPDRLAVYSFAHVPWVRPHQKRIDPSRLPDRDEKAALLVLTVETLTKVGYRAIGMDHFALPGDELARARDEGVLSRNFMGYTVQRVDDVVALGTSGISGLRGSYAQNHKRLASYYEALDRGELPVERGVLLTADDQIRRFVIMELMCNARVEADDVRGRFGIELGRYFDAELQRLREPGGLVDEGLAVVDDTEVRATPLGRLFIRNLAMVFDAYLGTPSGTKPVFSRTI